MYDAVLIVASLGLGFIFSFDWFALKFLNKVVCMVKQLLYLATD
jgi:hypothetical protein